MCPRFSGRRVTVTACTTRAGNRRAPAAWRLAGMVTLVLAYLLVACQPVGHQAAVGSPARHTQGRKARVAPTGPGAYYVNCRTGSDRARGSLHAPWRSPRELNGRTFAAGATVSFARGCTWHGNFTVAGSGTRKRPVLLTSYGRGRRPTFDGRSNRSSAVIKVVGDFVSVSNLAVTGAGQYGIQAAGSFDSIVRDAVSDAGGGVLVTGPGAVIDGVRVRNLHMIVDTPGGDNDYGAVGYDIQAPNAVVERSWCRNCIAPSHDYGHDGGFAEVWNSGDNLIVRNSVAINTAGFLEMGAGSADHHANNVRVTHNRMLDVHGGFWIHAGDAFTISTSSVLISRNVIVNRNDAGRACVLGGSLRKVLFTYNYVNSDLDVARRAPAVHHHNHFILRRGAKLGFRMRSGCGG
jgi:hypothetical protein